MNYHVFVVDNNTFKYHLEYMFAGTGAGDKTVPFLVDSDAYIHSTTERNLVGMIADVSRIRENDKIIFYLQAYNGNQGMFFGVFKAASSAYFDENDEKNYLKGNMYKALTFRIRIKPDLVFPIGISEHEYLDSLSGVDYPYQMCWSLIYRKLKGNRGCTMITDYEFESLVSKLKSINGENIKNSKAVKLTFDDNTLTIKENQSSVDYSGRIDSIAIKDRLLYKANRNQAFEVHLQAYIMQMFDKEPLKSLLLPLPNEAHWVGNEVSCGVGMQRIDIMIVQEKYNEVYIKVVELKSCEPYMDILDRQLPWYIKWVSEYVVPNYINKGKKVIVIPCVLAKGAPTSEITDACKRFNKSFKQSDSLIIKPAEYIGFNIDTQSIKFNKTV